MPLAGRGPRRSSALRTLRALLSIVFLQRADCKPSELVEKIEQLQPDVYPVDAIDALQKDIAFARRVFKCNIRYCRCDNTYRLLDPGIITILAPISSNDLPILAAIRSAFAGKAPLAAEVNEILDRIAWSSQDLPPISILLFSDGSWERVRKTVHEIERAYQQKRQLEFAYHSAGTDCLKRHVVEVHNNVESREGHLYLDAFSVQCGEFRTFRVDRIVPGSLRLLPRRTTARTRRWVEIRYKLSPEAVSDEGATHYFRRHQERRLANGWVEVTGEAPNVFTAAHILLHYGDSCIVQAPTELVEQISNLAAGMLKHYTTRQVNRTSRR